VTQGLPSTLPADFLRFAREKRQGITGFHGFYRLYGKASPSPYSLLEWNTPDCWRFAWPQLPSSLFFLGGSAWGDQYAFNLDAPEQGVLFLDAYEMAAETIAPTFTAFLADEFGRIAVAPYDERVLQAHSRFGALNWEDAIALVPPLLLARDEASCELVPSNMRSVMIMNGDVSSQLSSIPESARISGVTTYVDSKGRERLRLLIH